MNNYSIIPLDKIFETTSLLESNDTKVSLYAHAETTEGHFFILSKATQFNLNENTGKQEILGTMVLTHFDTDFNVIDQHTFPKLYEEIHSVYSRHEGSLLALPSGELVFSTSLNRIYIFDEKGQKIIHQFNSKVKSVLKGKKDTFENFNVDSGQDILNNNYYTRGALCPDTNQLLTLVDTLSTELVNEKRMRGEILAITENSYTTPTKRPDLILLHALNINWKSGMQARQFIPYIKGIDGDVLSYESWPKKPLVETLREQESDIGTNPIWIEQPLAMGNGQFLIPVYLEMFRGGTKGYPYFVFIMNAQGKFIHSLKGLNMDDDSAYPKMQFRFAVCKNDKKIFYKNDTGVYIFDFTGTLLEKYTFKESGAKPLHPYQLLGSTTDGRIVFYHEKKQEFLILSSLSEYTNLEDNIVNSLKGFKADKKAYKKNHSI